MTKKSAAPLSPLRYFAWVRRHWLLSACYLSLAAAIALIYTLQLPGLFQATTHVKFQREAADSGVFDQLTSLVLTNTPDTQVLQIDPIKHDLALAEYADGWEFNQLIVEHLQQAYPELLTRYQDDIRPYGDSAENALAYFVRYHFRVFRLKHDGFFIFRWYFFREAEAKQMLTSILELLDRQMTARREARYHFALEQLGQLDVATAPISVQQWHAELSSLFQTKLSASEQGQSQSLLMVLPTEVSAGWTYPRQMKVFIAAVTPWLVLGAITVNILLLLRRRRPSRWS